MSVFVTKFISNGPPSTTTDTLSLHDALPIFAADVGELEERGRLAAERRLAELRRAERDAKPREDAFLVRRVGQRLERVEDRKSTRLNSSHVAISYAGFCLKKKKSLKMTASLQ